MEDSKSTLEKNVSKLCLGCLLCCKGNICRVILSANELHFFSGMELSLENQSEQKYYFSKACPQLTADGCLIYFKHLPKDCSSYHCRTLKQLLKGGIDLKTAEQRVEEVKKQIVSVIAKLGGGGPDNSGMRDLINGWLNDKQYLQQPALLEEIRTLITDIDKNFHNKKQLLGKLPPKAKSGVKLTIGVSKQKPGKKLELGDLILAAKGLETPAYIIHEKSLEDLVANARALTEPTDTKLLYSVKANSIVPLIKKIAPLVDGLSCSSLPELLLARQSSGVGTKLHFTAPGIGALEAKAIDGECTSVSFNSTGQWRRYKWLIKRGLSGALRVNPHLSLAGKPHYDPCRTFSKLGISVNQLHDLWQNSRREFVNIDGLHMHTAVGEGDFKNLQRTVAIVEEKLPELLDKLSWINLGGGYRLESCKNQQIFIETCSRLKKKHGLQVYIEPGTALVQRACWLLATVIDIFTSDGKAVAILDSSINHQLESFIYGFRPSVYGSSKHGRYSYLLGGATCLAGDLLGEHRFNERLQIGSRVLFKSVGAYTHAFSIQYNGLNFPSIYWMKPDNSIILKRQFTLDDFARRCAAE
ncbi:MAG: hypothetical protein HQL70_05475 [Magnetococcales bacterium]|nr:hypothetical protein [Magnetococcales bacterium]